MRGRTVLVPFLWMAGCDATPPPAPPPPPASGTASAAARGLPAPEVSCSANDDCVLTGDELADAPPNTYACCSGCTVHSVRKGWLPKFHAACEANRPPMCPPLGCAAPILEPACEAGRCVARAKSAPPRVASAPAGLPPYPDAAIERARKSNEYGCGRLVYKRGCAETRTGTIEVEAILAEDGKVASVAVVKNGVSRDPKLVADCVTKAVSKWNFDPPKGVSPKVTLDFRFGDKC
jgi:hypothetical protein